MPKQPYSNVQLSIRTGISPRNLGGYPEPDNWVAIPYEVRNWFPVDSQSFAGQTTTPKVSGRYIHPTSYVSQFVVNKPSWFRTVIPHPSGISIVQYSPAAYQASTMDFQGAMTKCAFSLSSKLKAGDFSGGVALAEHAQTSRLLQKNARKIVQGLIALKKGHLMDIPAILGFGATASYRRKAAKLKRFDDVQQLSRFWLEIQYGWKPLYQDVYNAFEALHKARTRPDYLVMRASGSDSSYTESQTNGVTLTGNRASVRVNCRVHVSLSDQNQAILAANTAGITNPALVAWELVPFSFVADWFIPIGNYLDTVGTLSLTTFSNPVTSIKQDASRWFGGTYVEPYWGPGAYVSVEYGSCSMTEFQRLLISPSVSLPQFKNPFSLLHVANATALIVSLNPFKIGKRN